jgi:drug/metabolite transporter (DMT)-like permease
MSRSVALLALCGAIWGLSFTLSKIVMSEGAHPLAVSFWQAAGGAAVLLAAGRRPPRDGAHLRFYVVAGATGTAIPNVLIFSAAQHLGAGALAMCMAMAPLICFGLCALLSVERFEARRGLGLVVGLAAMALIAGPAGGAPWLWVLAAMGAAASYAGEEVFIALRRPPGADSFTLLCGMQIAGAIWLLPGLIASGAPLPVSARLGPVEIAFLVMMVSNLFAYGGFVALIARGGPIFASQVAYVVTSTGVLWGMAVLGERHPQGFWMALALMLAGLALGLPRRASAGA